MTIVNLAILPHRWQMSGYELKIQMGCAAGPKGGREWPDAGIPSTMIGNVQVWVEPAPHDGKRKHRALCTCPVCMKVVPAGRLHQHMKVHK